MASTKGLIRKAQILQLAFEQDRIELELWDRSENAQIDVELPNLEFAICYMCTYEEKHGQDTTALQVTFPTGDRIWLNGKFWRKDW